MTSSEELAAAEPPGPPQDPPPPSADAPVRIAGHLHPGMLFLRLFDGLRQALLPLILALVTQQLWIAGVAAFYFLVTMVYAVARYVTFQYRLTDEELITTEGILHRQERRLPVERIQDLNFESTLLRRIFGLVVVSVETASGQGSEARLDSLSRPLAEHLRETLYQVRARREGRPVEELYQEAQPQETLLYKVAGSELMLLGLTNNRLGAILLAVVGLFELFDEVGLGAQFVGAVEMFQEWLSSFSPPMVVLILGLLLFLFLLAGWALSIIASFVMFHGFHLTVRDAIFHRRFGLITTRAQTLPQRKIQRVLLGQPFLRRLLGLVTVRADSAGSGMDQREEARGGRDIIAPLTRNVVAEALVPWLLPGLEVARLGWNRVSPRVVLRIFLKGSLLAVGLAVAAPFVSPWLFAAAAAVLPVSWLVGWLAYGNLAWSRAPEHLALRNGIAGRYRAFVPLRKVQGVVLRAGPIERMLGLASLTVYVAGGSPTTQSNLPRREAELLKIEIARFAANSQFVW